MLNIRKDFNLWFGIISDFGKRGLIVRTYSLERPHYQIFLIRKFWSPKKIPNKPNWYFQWRFEIGYIQLQLALSKKRYIWNFSTFTDINSFQRCVRYRLEIKSRFSVILAGVCPWVINSVALLQVLIKNLTRPLIFSRKWKIFLKPFNNQHIHFIHARQLYTSKSNASNQKITSFWGKIGKWQSW